MTHIVFTAMPASGHVNPGAPLVQELVRRGIGVTVCATEQFRPLAESLGADVRVYPGNTISSQVIAEATAEGGSTRVVQRLLEATPTLLADLQSQMRADPPDAVMFDSNALWGRMLASRLDRPAISLMTTMLVGSSAFRALRAREMLAALRESAPAVPGALRARRRLLRSADAELLPPSPVLPTRGDLTLFPIPEWMQGSDPRLDASCRFVGPTLDVTARTEESDPELENVLGGTDPLVVVSLGTLHTGGSSFFRACVEALGPLPANVLLVVGSATDPAELGTPPANVVVRRFVPQLEALRQASVFVTHGGMNSVLEALHFGVPMVVIPQQVEQLLIGQAVADRGAGVVLRHHLSRVDIPAEQIRASVDALLHEASCTASARSLAATLHEGGGAEAAADHIEGLLAGTPA